jgi:uncharacterized peroxidase-related enzyme
MERTMTRIPLQDPSTATGRTKEVFDRVSSHYGMVPKLQQAMAPLPEITNAVWDLSTATMQEGSLTQEVKRAIFIVTAAAGECDYCVAAHMLALFRQGWTVEDCAKAVDGAASDKLSDAENGLLDYARVVAARPVAVTDEMMDDLRAQGWTDDQIVEATMTVALLKYTSTLATALGIPFEPLMQPLLTGPPFVGQ